MSSLAATYNWMQYLIDEGDFDARIHCAALNGDIDAIRKVVSEEAKTAKVLLERKIRPLGTTPLRLATTGGHVDTVRFLLDELGVSVDSLDVKGQTPLFVAVLLRNEECARVLLEHGANPEGSLENVCSPLSRATQEGCIECVLVLLEHGADTNDIRRLYHFLSDPTPPTTHWHDIAAAFYRRLVDPLNSNAFLLCRSPLHASVVHRRQNCYAALLLVGGAEPDLRQVEPRLPHVMVCSLSLAHCLLVRPLPECFIRWFVLFGGYLWQRDVRGVLAIEMDKTIHSNRILFERYMTHPLKLQNVCRICIRRCLGRKRLSSLSSLPLPTNIINFLKYKEEIDEEYNPLETD